MSALVTPNQSYLVRGMQFKLANALARIMNGLGDNVMFGVENDDWKHAGKLVYYPTGWHKDDMHFDCRRHSGSTKDESRIVFSAPRWDSNHSKLSYGTKTIDQNVNEADDTKTKVIKNDTDNEVHVSYEESVELTNSFSSSITKGMTEDLTMDASTDASATVGAEYMGVKAEATVAAHFGISKSKQESTELGKEESEEGTKSESLAIEFDAQARTYYLVEVTKENERTSQPFDIAGVMDFDITLKMTDPVHVGRHLGIHGDIKLKGFDALEQFLNGYDTDWAKVGSFMHDWHYSEAAKWLVDPANRALHVAGISHAALESNADYHVQQLGQHVPDRLAHLPVENANDL